ncbi:MAG TPA: hypothetical protein VM366_16640 [Anaerolineae bacterium]|nr:hypothetical protein [Anaerolineae bacterium]
MSQDSEEAVIFLHQVKMGDLFYSGPVDVRAWIRGWPVHEACLVPVEVPVQRGGASTHTNGMAQGSGRTDHGDDRRPRRWAGRR